jgi:hypothetical protein
MCSFTKNFTEHVLFSFLVVSLVVMGRAVIYAFGAITLGGKHPISQCQEICFFIESHHKC